MGRYVTNTTWLPSSGSQSLILGLTSTSLNTETVDDAILRREGFLDGFLGERWLPSTYATAPMVSMLTQDMVTYDLLVRLYNDDGGLQSNESIEGNYTIALNSLEQLRDGKLSLYTSSGVSIAEKNLTRKYSSNSRDYTRTFNEDSPLSWTTSTRKLRDIADDRRTDQ